MLVLLRSTDDVTVNGRKHTGRKKEKGRNGSHDRQWSTPWYSSKEIFIWMGRRPLHHCFSSRSQQEDSFLYSSLVWKFRVFLDVDPFGDSPDICFCFRFLWRMLFLFSFPPKKQVVKVQFEFFVEKGRCVCVDGSDVVVMCFLYCCVCGISFIV